MKKYGFFALFLLTLLNCICSCTPGDAGFPNYETVQTADTFYLTDGSIVYEPFVESDNWCFYGHAESPIGRTDRGNLVLGFKNDEQHVFVQEKKKFWEDMDYRVFKRNDAVLPTIADVDLSAGDEIVLHINGRANIISDKDTLNEIAEQYHNTNLSDSQAESDVFSIIGDVSYYFNNYKQCYFKINIYVAENSKTMWLYNVKKQFVEIENGTTFMKLIQEVNEMDM